MSTTRHNQMMKLLSQGQHSIAGISQAIGCTETEARNTLARMQTRCLARPVDGTRPKEYRLTAMGLEELQRVPSQPARQPRGGLYAPAQRAPAAWRPSR